MIADILPSIMRKHKTQTVLSVDEYIHSLPSIHAHALEVTRAALLSFIPHSTEKLHKGAITFSSHNSQLFTLSVDSHLCHLRLVGATLPAYLRKELHEYSAGVEGISFTPSNPIPPRFLSKLVNFRLSKQLA